MPSTSGRRVVEALTNKSGGAVAAGDVVVIDTANDEAFTTTTSAGFLGTIGVAQEAISNNAVGRVLTAGYAALVNVNASVTRGNFGKTHTVAKQATDAGSSRGAGAFCQFLTGGASPKAHVFGIADAASSSSGVPSGTSNPGSPSDGDLFFRTDLDLLIRYRSSGTRWVTVNEYSVSYGYQDVLAGGTNNNQVPGYIELDNGTHDLWVERIACSTTVATTNNGSNYYTVTFFRRPSGTSLGSFNTSADTAGTNTRHDVTVGALTGTSDRFLDGAAGKTGSPGGFYGIATVFWRKVIT